MKRRGKQENIQRLINIISKDVGGVMGDLKLRAYYSKKAIQ